MDSVIEEVVRAVIQIVAPIIAGLVVVVLVAFVRKLGLEIGAEQEAKLRLHVQGAILAVEERAAAAAKHYSSRLDPSEKLAQAVESVMLRVPGITEAEATRLIHEELPKVAAGAAGFLGSVRNAATTGPTSE